MAFKCAHNFVLHTLGDEVRCEETAEHVRTFVANKVTVASRLSPVDVGYAGAEESGGWSDGECVKVMSQPIASV